MITDPFRGFRASQNLRAYGCSRHFCTFTSNRISQVFTTIPYQERIQIIFLTCGRGSRWYWFCGHGWPYLGWFGSPMVRQILLSMGHRYVNAFLAFYWRFLQIEYIRTIKVPIGTNDWNVETYRSKLLFFTI